jgi:glycosyltransferase involved in cell wall biosynthesis
MIRPRNGLPLRIHQFSPNAYYGDGISNGMLFTRRLLQSAGCESEIFCNNIDERLHTRIHHIDDYPGDVDPERVLLIHHGIGCDMEAWLENLPDLKILVFHNITPEYLFPDDDPILPLLRQGWDQLISWRNWLHGAIADSDTNRDLLLERDYDPARCLTLPLLVDLEKLTREKPIPEARPLNEDFRLLFVGRITPHKNQLGLIDALWHLRRMTGQQCTLQLVGSGDGDYARQIEDRIEQRGLSGCVELTGKVTDQELAQAFAQADVYLSLSRHEGFGMPLVEAAAQQLPIVAYQAKGSQVAGTVGAGGLVLDSDDPAVVAATLASLMEQPLLRRRFVATGASTLDAYAPPLLLKNISTLLARAASARANVISGLATPKQTENSNRDRAIKAPCETTTEARQYAAPPALTDGSKIGPVRIEGPFEGSYSLALVNRSLARALQDLGETTQLHPSEGPGDYLPSAASLKAIPEAAALYRGADTSCTAKTVLRLMYPLRLHGMTGLNHVVSCYGWEESELPASTVLSINTYAHAVTTMSSYVTRVLLNSGVRVPVATVGLGADHRANTRAKLSNEVLFRETARSIGKDGDLCFLHISSGFPRKGIDVLLDAFATAFNNTDSVKLIIKTFPNPHHSIDEDLAEWRTKYPDAADVELINRDLQEDEVSALYARCHVLVAPSRGEGFGLPMAEAMLLGLAVVTTGSGGQSDFCDENTAWLIDYEMGPARSHLSTELSVWAEPKVSHLESILRELYGFWTNGCFSEATSERRRLARMRIQHDYSWRETAKRTQRVIAAIDKVPPQRQVQRTGCVTTWNARCGIATYSKLLLSNTRHELTIFANSDADLTADDEAHVRRCWRTGGSDDLSALLHQVLTAELTDLLVQFNFAFFALDALAALINALQNAGVRVWLFCHSTADVQEPEQTKSLSSIRDSLVNAERIIVHTVEDINILKAHRITDNVCLFPHGVVSTPKVAAAPTELADKLRDKRVIASYGFLLPHKGIQPLIKAFARLLDQYSDAHLLLVNAKYPAPASEAEAAACQELVIELELEGQVTLITEYLDDAESFALLGLAERLVFPYGQTQESSSAAVRWGLAANKPVHCSPLQIFNDVADVVSFLPGNDPDGIYEGLLAALSDQGDPMQVSRQNWLAKRDWKAISKRLDDMLSGVAAHHQLAAAIEQLKP